MRLKRSSCIWPVLVVVNLLTGAFFAFATAGEEERQFSRDKLQQMQGEPKYAYYLDDKAPEQVEGVFNRLMNRLFQRIVPSPVLEFMIGWLPYMIMIAAVVLIGSKFFGYNFSSPFRRQRKTKYSGYVFENDPGINHGNALETQWKIAMERQDYRLAIRFAYRIILDTLDQYHCVEWKPHKPNHQYLNELKGMPLHDDFEMAGKIFEYVWYGDFPADQKRCDQMAYLSGKIMEKAKQSGKNSNMTRKIQ